MRKLRLRGVKSQSKVTQRGSSRTGVQIQTHLTPWPVLFPLHCFCLARATRTVMPVGGPSSWAQQPPWIHPSLPVCPHQSHPLLEVPHAASDPFTFARAVPLLAMPSSLPWPIATFEADLVIRAKPSETLHDRNKCFLDFCSTRLHFIHSCIHSFIKYGLWTYMCQTLHSNSKTWGEVPQKQEGGGCGSTQGECQTPQSFPGLGLTAWIGCLLANLPDLGILISSAPLTPRHIAWHAADKHLDFYVKKVIQSYRARAMC